MLQTQDLYLSLPALESSEVTHVQGCFNRLWDTMQNMMGELLLQALKIVQKVVSCHTEGNTERKSTGISDCFRNNGFQIGAMVRTYQFQILQAQAATNMKLSGHRYNKQRDIRNQ